MTEQKNIWELQHTTICKVVGMALDLEDLKRVLRKFKLRIKDSHVDEEFSLHSVVVRMCGEEGKFSRHVQKLIESRFSRYGKRLVHHDSAELAELILKGDPSFDVPLWAILWYLSTRNLSSGDRVQAALFGIIHMLEHRLVKDFWKNSGADHQREEADNRVEIDSLRKELIRLRSSYSKLEKENRRFSQRQAPSERCHGSSSPPPMARQHGDGSLYVEKIERLKRLLEEARDRKRDLEEECQRSKKQIEALTTELLTHENTEFCAREESADETCTCHSRCSLNGKRIAMVGGIDSLEPHYKCLVEESGGEFCRHDGRSCRGERKLDECIRNADLVVCPVSINSHFGAIGVKKVCRRYGISCCFPDSAGLGCFRGILLQHFTPVEQDRII
jgi:hypothetical protein